MFNAHDVHQGIRYSDTCLQLHDEHQSDDNSRARVPYNLLATGAEETGADTVMLAT